jgi:hypothetical protein
MYVCVCVCACVYMCACVNKTPEELQYQQSFVSAGEDMVSTDKYGVDLTSMGSEHLLANIFHYPPTNNSTYIHALKRIYIHIYI